MESIKKILEENLNKTFISGILSGPRQETGCQKVKIRPILKKDQLYFQCEKFCEAQVFHDNVDEDNICEVLMK